MGTTDESRERLERVCALFDEARELPAAARASFLDALQRSDEALHAEVEELLQHHTDESDLLDNPVLDSSVIPTFTAAHEPLPAEIGGYEIISRLGAGGMGIVYRARQANPGRDVAIKVMRSGLLDQQLTKRFELETAILGRLQHPHVAQIYAAGIHESGERRQPYFVMEFIDGPPLSDHLRQTEPSTEERLRLFAAVADAVHHAHQKGVIHRDLKPSNILVHRADSPDDHTSNINRATPKVLDFGVARATDADLQATTYLTDVGQIVGTLPYMSPEQVGGHAEAIDTRADVYALGVILFEMLDGQLPYQVDGRSIAAAARTIVEAEPKTLAKGHVDLQTIVSKALEKEPERRYQSVADLGADIRRFLNDEPIEARPASAWYQLQKFAKRNRGLVGGLVATLVALLLGIAGTTWQAILRNEPTEAG